MVRHRLREFELHVLLAIGHLGEDAYGVTIRRLIEERSRRPVSNGAVYATLARLEARGLVRFRVSAPLPVPGGRSRKYARLTPAGERTLRESTASLLRMMDGLGGGLVPERR